MSKKIHTIQSSDKSDFDDKVNLFLEVGCELMEGGYSVINNDDGVVYSQVVLIDEKKCEYHSWEEENIYYLSSIDKTGKMNGLSIRLSDRLFEKCYYKNNKRHGLFIEYDEYSGIETIKGHYKNDKKDGLWIYRGRDGQVLMEGSFLDDKKTGKWVSWYNKDKNLRKWDISYSNGGKKDGLCIKWTSDGQIEQKEQYKNDEKDGKCSYYLGGLKEREENYVDGQPNGEWIYWYKNRQIQRVELYKDGKPHGIWKHYDSSGLETSRKKH